MTRNVYAHSLEECEKLLAEIIREEKPRIAAERERLKLAAKAGDFPAAGFFALWLKCGQSKRAK